MSMVAAFEGVLFLFLLAGAGGGPANPKAPAPAQVLRYAPADAEFVAYADVASLLPRARHILDEAAKHPIVREVSELRGVLAMVQAQVEQELRTVHDTFGVDPMRDLAWGAIFAQWPTAPGESVPRVLIQIEGTLPPDLLNRMVGALGGELAQFEGKAVIRHPQWMAGLDAGGAFLMGTPAWVEERLGSTWKAERSTALAAARTLLAKKPQILVASAPSADTARAATEELARDKDMNALRDLVTGHRFAALAVGPSTMGWSWHGQDAQSYRRGLIASEGLVDLMRAGVHGARGLARLAFAVLPSYVDQVPPLRVALNHQAEILKLVDELSGDANFKASVLGTERLQTVEVSAVSKGASPLVMPMLLPLGAGALFFLTASKPAPSGASEVHEKSSVAPGDPY